MSNRFFLAVIVSTCIAFLGGWLIFGFVFSDYYMSNTKEVAKIIVKNQPQMWAVAIANVAWVLLITCVLQKNENETFVKGFTTSLWISFFIMLVINFSVYAFWDIYPLGFILIDIIITTLFWSIIGGIIGAILGGEKK